MIKAPRFQFTAPYRFLVLALLALFSTLLAATDVHACRYCTQAEQFGSAMAPEQRQYVAPDRNFSTKHISLDLDLDVRGGTIAGSVTHTLEVLKPGAQELRLNAVALTIDGVSIDGVPVKYEYPVTDWQETSPDGIWIAGATLGDSHDGLVVHAAAPLTRGQQIKLKVDYHGAPKEGLYFITPDDGLAGSRPEVWSQGEGERNRYWIPCFDYPNEKATFDGTFRVDPDMQVLSNGRLDGVSTINSKSQFHWVLEQPQVTYLIMVAAGDYEVYKDNWRGKDVTYYVPPGTGEEMARDVFKQTPDMLDCFSDALGIEYPFDKYAQVVVQNFIFGGMENTSATVLNSRTLYDRRALLSRDGEDLIAHELAHQWWGDMVTLREWNHMWLNEGFATFFQKYYKQHHKGDDEYVYDFDGAHSEVIGADADARPMVVDFFNRTDARSSSNVYPKGATVLDMLRQYLGDEVFFDALHRYGTEMRFKNADTQDLMRAFRDASGENLDWFFEQWVYLAGHPDLRVSKSWDSGRGMLTLKVEQTQAQSNLVPLFRLPLDVEISCAEKTENFRILVSQQSQEFNFRLPSAPLMVLFDKGGHTLKTLDFPRSVEELVYQLDHGDTFGRIEAARGLGALGENDTAFEALKRTLMADGFWGMRKECARALRASGHQQAPAALLAALDSPDAKVREAAADALGGKKNTPELEAKLLWLLDNDEAYWVRSEALESLCQCKSEKAYSACIAALEQDSENETVRATALSQLGSMDPLPEGVDRAALLETLAQYATAANSREYRHNAINAYAAQASRLKDAEAKGKAADFLLPMLDDWYVNTRSTVIGAVQNIGDLRAIDQLRRMSTQDPVERIRNQAKGAASNIAARVDPQTSLDELKAQMKAMQDEIEALKKGYGEVKEKQAEQPVK